MARPGRPAPDTSRIDPASPVHLLRGEDAFLRDRRERELVAQLAPGEDDGYNRETFVGPELDLDRVVIACETLPIFTDRRLVVVRHFDPKLAIRHAAFLAYLRRPNPSTVLLLISGSGSARDGEEGERGGGAKTAKGAVTVKDLLALIPSREDLAALRPEEAMEFARKAARERGVDIATDVVRELVDLVGSDAGRLDDEIEKASLYIAPRRRIEIADVERLARRTRSHTLFELTDAIANGDREAVLRHLGFLLEDGAEPLALIGMIGFHLRRTLRGAALVAAGQPPAEVARAVGVYWKLADRFVASCRRLGVAGTARAIGALRVADRRLKSTAEQDRIVLERTLVELLGG